MEPVSLPDLGCDGLLCRYSEIATKGRNRRAFEKRLVEALRRALRPLGKLDVALERGRIFIRPGGEKSCFTAADLGEMRRVLPFVSGLSSASPGILTRPELGAIEEAVERSFPALYGAHAAAVSGETPVTYAMQVRRGDKSFPLIGTEVEIHFAERLLDRFPRLKVDLRQARLQVEVEIRRDRAFVSYERIQGPGGLPAGTGGKVLALLSGGIDSPVACYQMMRRGCLVDYVTFHSEPYTPPELISKVACLARLLNRFQMGGRLLAVNLLPLQRQIRDHCQERYRTVLYRRGMMRLSAALARLRGAKALMTGDNLGQVASQTIDNLVVVDAATPMLVLRPLLVWDKQDTSALARRIGTLAESERDVPDSCTVFAPASPATTSRLVRLQAEERRLDGPALLRECLLLTREIDLDTLERREVPGLERVADSLA
ncbi:MAG: tRNA 4-thiouridine(8) synthase ThiI [Lentisphaeria bacterium]|nr:tRNA 4-thiouridine(8) synthase ThiI [Lentisphaeria bacterium]